MFSFLKDVIVFFLDARGLFVLLSFGLLVASWQYEYEVSNPDLVFYFSWFAMVTLSLLLKYPNFDLLNEWQAWDSVSLIVSSVVLLAISRRIVRRLTTKKPLEYNLVISILIYLVSLAFVLFSKWLATDLELRRGLSVLLLLSGGVMYPSKYIRDRGSEEDKELVTKQKKPRRILSLVDGRVVLALVWVILSLYLSRSIYNVIYTIMPFTLLLLSLFKQMGWLKNISVGSQDSFILSLVGFNIAYILLRAVL
eukprot:TRINITY_DN757_c0_g1_i2.p1 TRINITY_DN757_c0_g1~~TRINITY_DN757_c0_g1_i2.p1  ORF type:complete len:252 (+),score=39.69 TRINITY_DN757_c0_g1_i2:244-999(+)